MNSKNIANALVTGKTAAEKRGSVSAINAISHIVWDEDAFTQTAPSVKYTMTGLALNTAACISWAVVQELLVARGGRRALGAGAATALLAYVTDYYIVPKRLTPGFEKHLSNRSLLLVYIVLAVGLAAGNAARNAGND